MRFPPYRFRNPTRKATVVPEGTPPILQYRGVPGEPPKRVQKNFFSFDWEGTMLTPDEWLELEHEREDDLRREAVNEDLVAEIDDEDREEWPPVFDWQ